MRNHLHNRAFEAPSFRLAVGHKHKEAQCNKTHVADGRIRHQFFHVGLHQRNQTDIHHRNQAQHDNRRREIARSVGQNRQCETQEAVCAHFQRNRRQHHRTARRRFNVRVRQPGVHGEHRHFHRKRQEECDKQQLLHAQRNVFQVLQIGNHEAVGLRAQINQRNQHQQRTGQRVQEQLHGGIHAPRAAPHTNNQVQRNQHAFKEHIKQNRVPRRKRAVNQTRHDKEGRHILRRAFLNHLPACQHHHQRNERIQDDEQHGNAVHTQRVVQVQRGNPRMQLLKLVAAAGAVEMREQRQSNGKAGRRAQKRQYPRQRRTLVRACRQHQHACQNRQPNG